MNSSRRNLLVLTHEYNWLLAGFTYLWARYLGEPVTVVADQEMELPAGFEFMRVPCFSEGSWPWDHWFSHGLRETLLAVPEPVVSLWVPDAWLVGPVNRQALDDLTDYVLAHPEVLRMSLNWVQDLKEHCQRAGEWHGLEILAPGRHNASLGYLGGMAFGAALWSRRNLIDCLEPGWSLWGFEAVGTQRMWDRRPDLVSLAAWPEPLRRTNVISRGKTVHLSELGKEDRETVRRWVPSDYQILES